MKNKNNKLLTVVCHSIRESMPNQIELGVKYLIDRDSIYVDSDGDWYGRIYDIWLTRDIGIMNLKHFKAP